MEDFNIHLNIFRDSDILIGGLDETIQTTELFVASSPYYHDDLTWCVQQKKPIPTWKNFFLLCNDPMIYVLFTIVCFVYDSVTYFLQQFEDLQQKWDWFKITTSGFCIVSGFAFKYRPQNISSRIMFIFSIWGCMIFDIILLSICMKILNTRYYVNQIETIQEIADSFDLVGDGFALQHLMKQNHVNYIFFKCISIIIIFTNISMDFLTDIYSRKMERVRGSGFVFE